jgi:hypothetical protein
VTGDGVDRIDELAATLDALDQHLQHSDAAVRRSVRYRLTLLHLHAVFAVYIGLQFTRVDDATMASPSWAVIRSVPGSPISLGLLLFTGGLILGISAWLRRIIGELVGLCLLLLWYLTIASSFGGALLWWRLGLLPPGTPPPAPYSHGIYLHLSAVMVVHIGALIRIHINRKRLKARRQ